MCTRRRFVVDMDGGNGSEQLSVRAANLRAVGGAIHSCPSPLTLILRQWISLPLIHWPMDLTVGGAAV